MPKFQWLDFPGARTLRANLAAPILLRESRCPNKVLAVHPLHFLALRAKIIIT